VFTSIVVGIANLRAHARMDRVWKLTLAYFFSTTSLAILLGMAVVNIFRPGVGADMDLFKVHQGAMNVTSMGLGEYINEFVNGLFLNPFAAMAQGNILPTIIFAMFLGIALVVMKDDRAHTILRLFNEFFDLIMLITAWIMLILPVGLFCLLTDLFASQDAQLLQVLGKYILVVIGAKLFHGLVTLPSVLFLLTGKSPKAFFAGARDALVTAFSTSSSSATLPITMNCAEKNLKVDKDIAGFVLPLGATMNMDGTALYEAVAAIFIANLVGVELSLIQQATVFATAMIASVGAPGIPSAGLVTMMMVLQSVGLPVEAVAILIPIDRPLDAIRTTINVEGDLIGSMVVQRYTKV
jgi:Na+/H+-dicarboxylate symporter